MLSKNLKKERLQFLPFDTIGPFRRIEKLSGTSDRLFERNHSISGHFRLFSIHEKSKVLFFVSDRLPHIPVIIEKIVDTGIAATQHHSKTRIIRVPA